MVDCRLPEFPSKDGKVLYQSEEESSRLQTQGKQQHSGQAYSSWSCLSCVCCSLRVPHFPLRRGSCVHKRRAVSQHWPIMWQHSWSEPFVICFCVILTCSSGFTGQEVTLPIEPSGTGTMAPWTGWPFTEWWPFYKKRTSTCSPWKQWAQIDGREHSPTWGSHLYKALHTHPLLG